MFRLLGARRFGPLFATQFLGAFNDNLYKTAMLFLITYRLMGDDPKAGTLMVTIASGVFILPFFLFSALAGQLSDAVDKARVVRAVKAAEVAIMAVGAAGLLLGSVPLLMLALFAMGTHSTFFGPVKYAILPQHLADGELLGGTGLVEAGTFVAILAGQIVAGLISEQSAAVGVLVVAVIGLLTGRRVPPALPAEPVKIDWNIARSSLAVIREVTHDRQLLLAMLGVSWFWAVGAVLTSLFVPLVKDALHAGEAVATMFLAIFSVGIALGSLSANRLLKGRVSARFAPAASIVMSAFMLDLYFAFAPTGASDSAPLLDPMAFLSMHNSWRYGLDLIGLSVSGGIFVVPLYAMLQRGACPSERARVIAANNIVNSLFMVVATLVAGAIAGLGDRFGIHTEIRDVFLILAVANIGGILVTAKLVRLESK